MEAAGQVLLTYPFDCIGGNLGKKYKGYNVYKNKIGNKIITKTGFVIRYIAFGVLIDFVVFFVLGAILISFA